MAEIDKFFEGLKQDVPFEQKPAEQVVEPKKEDEEPEGRKNRQHRRLEAKLQAEREANIALSERIKVLSEIGHQSHESSGELDPDLLRAFGNSDEGKEVVRIFSKKLDTITEQAEQRALEKLAAQQDQERSVQREYESFIDSQLEALEDEHDVDLTSNAPKARKMRNEFLELIGKLSPKDDEGNPIQYADFESTFELYKQQQESKGKPDTSRQKEIASRTMQRSSPQSAPENPGRITFKTASRFIDSLKG